MPDVSFPFVRVVLILLGLFSLSKGLIPDVQGWGIHNWYVTYESGFIKRGLIGSVFYSIFGSASQPQYFTLIVAQHVTLCIMLLLTVASMAQGCIVNRSGVGAKAILIGMWSLFVCSQFFPTIAYNVGYLDVHLALLITLIILLMSAKNYLLASFLAAIGPFIHEMFLFLWLCPAFLLTWSLIKDSSANLNAKAVLLVAPFFSTAIVLFLHSQDAVIAELADAPIDDETRAFLIQVHFGQNTERAFLYMMYLFKTYTINAVTSFLFFTIPSLIFICASLYIWLREGRLTFDRAMALIIAAFAPLIILALAWDLSRFLIMANLTTVLAFIFIDRAISEVRCE